MKSITYDIKLMYGIERGSRYIREARPQGEKQLQERVRARIEMESRKLRTLMERVMKGNQR
jgi:hypothetical protein